MPVRLAVVERSVAVDEVVPGELVLEVPDVEASVRLRSVALVLERELGFVALDGLLYWPPEERLSTIRTRGWACVAVPCVRPEVRAPMPLGSVVFRSADDCVPAVEPVDVCGVAEVELLRLVPVEVVVPGLVEGEVEVEEPMVAELPREVSPRRAELSDFHSPAVPAPWEPCR